MIIKKFIGKTEEEAVAQAKAELGENIVIMNVKNAKKKGAFSFLKKQQIEVTVAREAENEKYPSPQAASQEEASIRETFRQIARAAGTDSPADGENKEAGGSGAGRRSQSLMGKRREEPAEAAIEEKLDSLESMIKERLKPAEETEDKKEAAQEEDAEKEEENSEMVRFIKILYNMMLDNEVNEKYANQMIEEMEKGAKPDMPFDYALANVYQKMILKFGKAEPIEEPENIPRVVFFVGPTGVGKTTTIAKIASKFSVEEKKRVALLTADTYRIAAAEQLRTYASILEVPFRVIYSVEEMKSALQDFKDYDYILVDTAGHSHQNVVQKENMSAFIHSLDGVAEREVHLVLSATTKYRDLISIADTYMEMTDFKIIFTKIDETITLGNLLNLRLYTGAPLSYITNGQNVPDDIEIFNPQKVVKKLLGGKN